MPVDLATALDELEESMRTTSSERELVEQIDDQLARLRALYRQDKASFQPADLQRLWFAGYVRGLAEELMRVRQQLAAVRDPRAYPGIECALVELEEGLREYAVVERVRKELAYIDEKAPTQRASKRDLDEARAVARENEMEARGEPCLRGHQMKLRNGKRGLFWGCSRYPKCRETRELSEEEKAITR